MRSLLRRYPFVAFGAVVAVAVAAALIIAAQVGSSKAPEPASAPAASRSSLRVRFESLARAKTNSCGLQPGGLATMAAGNKLQGSCCTRMDLTRYVAQRRGLRAYRRLPQVPQDPYDIRVSLATTLVRYNAIRLTRTERSVYRAAVAKSKEKGPCCCRCWRWTAFEGQAKYLIARRRFDAAAVAHLWDLEDGCGGPSDSNRGRQ